MLLLWLVFETKHYIADYVWQTEYMLRKFLPTGWERPLAAHCLVHAGLTLAICLFVNPALAVGLALLDFVVHFAMDRVKASPRLLGRYKSLCASEFKDASKRQMRDNRRYWLAMGFDQYVHHVTNLAIVAILVSI